MRSGYWTEILRSSNRSASSDWDLGMYGFTFSTPVVSWSLRGILIYEPFFFWYPIWSSLLSPFPVIHVNNAPIKPEKSVIQERRQIGSVASAVPYPVFNICSSRNNNNSSYVCTLSII